MREDLSGRIFGRWTVIAFHDVDRGRNARWLARCICGAERVVKATLLRSGDSQSCGCLQRDVVQQRSTRHGGGSTPEYKIWTAMKQRCLTPQMPVYKDYGGRGIKVCSRWLKFENFIADMGPRPSSAHTLERQNNDGNYEAANCRWALRSEQQNNRRPCIRLTHNGRTQTIRQWERELGFARGTIQCRIERGWTTERALTEAPQATNTNRDRIAREASRAQATA